MMKKVLYSAVVIFGVVCMVLFGIRVATFMAQAPNSAMLSSGDVAKMSMLDKMRAQHYFRDHSFDFPAIFSSYHPGPYWMLKKKKDFKFTGEQVKQEEDLKMGMAKSTIQDEAILKQAYETYASDSAKLNPPVEQIMSDIDAIGKAQTSLASEMVVYHLKGYALLNPAQKKVYQRLVAKRTK
ncbi:MAG: hypothetical protein ACYCSP_07365 [Acidobacteriaceae bacterium]